MSECERIFLIEWMKDYSCICTINFMFWFSFWIILNKHSFKQIKHQWRWIIINTLNLNWSFEYHKILNLLILVKQVSQKIISLKKGYKFQKVNNNYYQIFHPSFLLIAASIRWTVALLLDYNPLRLVTACPLHLNILGCMVSLTLFFVPSYSHIIVHFPSLLTVPPFVVAFFFPLHVCVKHLTSVFLHFGLHFHFG